MFEAFKVGVTIKLRDMVTPELLRLAAKIEETDKLVASLNRGLGKLSARSLSEPSAAMREMASNLGEAERRAQGLNRALNAPRTMASTIPRVSTTVGAGRIGGAAGVGGGGHGGGLHGGNLHVGPGGAGFGGVGIGLAGDAIPYVAGAYAAYHAAHGAIEAASEMQTMIAEFKMLGVGEQMTAEAVQFAKGMNIMGSSYVENMKAMLEAQGTFRESGLSGSAALEGAKLAAPVLAKIGFVTKAMDEEKRARLQGQSMDMLRFIEMSGGLQNPSMFNRLANDGWKAIQSSQGNIDWAQLRQFKAKSGTAGMLLTDEELFGRLEPVIGELKGGAAGDGLMTGLNRLNGSVKVPNQVAQLLVKSNIWDGSKISWNSLGGVKTMNGNPFKDNEMFMKTPSLFYENKIRPMYSLMGITQPADVSRMNNMIFGRTGGRLFTQIDKQMPVLHQSLEAWKKAEGIDDSASSLDKTYEGKKAEFRAAWTDFKTVYGTSILPDATKILKAGTDLMKSAINIHEAQGFMGTLKATWSEWNRPFKEAEASGAGKLPPPSGQKPSSTPEATKSPYVATQNLNISAAPVTVNLDGKKVAESTIKFITRGASAPLGSGFFDPTISAPLNIQNR